MTKPKFKIGDRVMILPYKEGEKYAAPGYVNEMLSYGNRVGKIVRYSDHNFGVPCYLLDNNAYTWREEWLTDRPMKLKAMLELLK
jgi:hypothetical protein